MLERTTVGAMLRATQAYCGLVCQKETLQHGICYYAPESPNLAEANQFREVVLDDKVRVETVFDEAEHWFAKRDLVCRRWAVADGCSTEALRSYLMGRGFRERRWTAMRLETWEEASPSSDIRILPARAMRSAGRKTFAINTKADGSASQSADAWLARMDDPSFDAFVAMIDGEPAGRIALHQVGDIAQVADLSVRERFADAGVDRALLTYTLSLARRLAIRYTCARLEEEDQRRALFESAGFVADGCIVEFDRD